MKNMILGAISVLVGLIGLIFNSCIDTTPSFIKAARIRESQENDTIVITKKLIIDSCTTYRLDTIYKKDCNGATSIVVNKKEVKKPIDYLVYFHYINGAFPDSSVSLEKLNFDAVLKGDKTTLYKLCYRAL